MKTLFKFVKWIFSAFFSIILLYLVFAVLLSYISNSPEEHNCTTKKEIYIASNGVHLFVILPVDNIKSKISDRLNFDSDTKYISFGWGDKEFYLNTPKWEDLTVPVTLNALFIPSESAMHVYYFGFKSNNWNKILVCEIQLQALNNYILSSFASENRKFLKIQDAGYTDYDEFYNAHGYYTCFYTSNQWICEALKTADVKTSIWSPFDFGVLWHIK